MQRVNARLWLPLGKMRQVVGLEEFLWRGRERVTDQRVASRERVRHRSSHLHGGIEMEFDSRPTPGDDLRDITRPRAFTRGTRPRKRLSMPRETSVHATPCRKTPYARRKTRTPRPWGQGVHSEPSGAPVSRAPLEVVLDRRRSDAQSPCARVRPRRAVDITRSHAADTCSRMPSACATRRMVSSRGCDDGCSAL
jgi:hypothetical protein